MEFFSKIRILDLVFVWSGSPKFLEKCMCFAFPPKTCARVEENGGGGRVENHYLPPRIMEVKNGPTAKGNHSSLEIQTVSTSVTIGEEECTTELVGNSGLVRSNATVCLVSLGPLGVFPPVMYTLSSLTGEFPNYGHSGVSHYFENAPLFAMKKLRLFSGYRRLYYPVILGII